MAGGIAMVDPAGQHVEVSQPYESLAAELHDAFQDSLGPSPEPPLMAQFLDEHPGRALEIGCGSGRLLLPLCQAGFELEGLELSPEMRAMAQRRATQLGLEPTIHPGDMDDWRPPQAYHSLLAPAFTLQLAPDPRATLRRWRDWLTPGGGLYFSVFIPYAELTGELPENQWYEDHEALLEDGRKARLETRHHFEGDELLLVREHRYHIEGLTKEPYECRQTIRWAEAGQWQEWLQEAGLEPVVPILDWDPAHRAVDAAPEDSDGILTFATRLRE